MYKEYLAKFWYSAKALENFKVFFSVPTGGVYGEVWVNTFMNAIGAHYLPHSSEYVAPPSIDIVKPWFETIGYGETILAKGTLKKSLILLGGGTKPNQPEEPPFLDHMLAICNAPKLVVFKAPKPSSNGERVPQGIKPGAKPRHKKHSTSSKQPSVSSSEAIKASTTVVAEMHKEDQQATGGTTSLGVTSEERANPQLSSGMSVFNLNEPIYSASFIIHSESASGNDALAVSTAEADLGKSAPSDFIPQQQGMNEGTKNTSYDHLFAGTDLHVLADKTQSVSEGLETVLTQSTTGKEASSIAKQVEEDEASRTIKLEDPAKLVSSVQPSFKDLDSPKDDPIIVVDDSDEDEEVDKVHATINTETEDASVPKSTSPSSLLTELKELPSKFNELAKEVKGLKKQVLDLEIELPGELKEIPTKLEDFTKTITSLTSQVAKLKTLQYEHLVEFLSVPIQVEVIQTKLKTLDALPSLLHKVTNALNQFAQAIASKKTNDNNVPSAGQADTQPAEGEKNTNQVTISQLFQRKAAKNANLKKQQSKPTPPPTTPIIPPEAEKESTDNDSDDETHVTGSMVESSRIKKKIEEEAKFEAAKYEIEVRKEELVDLLAELGLNLDIPLSEWDPLDKLNDLANKKRKHVDDIHHYFKANKRVKSSVQYEDHLAGTMLNEHVLGMIMLNSYHRHDFVTIEDLKDFSNTMLYTVQEIFFRRHQGPRLDDYARTFSFLLLAEVDKRNLNPLKQMRVIEQLRQ
ncbi:hypothetical protein Tco_0307138 [Tanacetum coccineum]